MYSYYQAIPLFVKGLISIIVSHLRICSPYIEMFVIMYQGELYTIYSSPCYVHKIQFISTSKPVYFLASPKHIFNILPDRGSSS